MIVDNFDTGVHHQEIIEYLFGPLPMEMQIDTAFNP